MMDQWTERLSEYLDGGIENEERRELEAHLASCAECAGTLEELRQVVTRAGRLEPALLEQDLWPAIVTRLKPRRSWRLIPWTGAAEPRPRRFTFSFPQLAAAGLLLILLSGGTVWLVLDKSRVHPAPPAPTPASPSPMAYGPVESRSTSPPPATSSPPSSVPAASGEASLAAFDTGRYDAAVAELERVITENRSRLDPATVRTIEQNLRIIDQAIGQARKALDADPANPYLNGHLAEQMSRKIKLLQLASQVVTAHS